MSPPPPSNSASTTEAPAFSLPTRYVSGDHEPRVSRRWEDIDLGHAEPGGDREAYSIVIPPPNVTAALHLGHALNNSLQDILIRTHRMRGANVMWMPGTDHAGIATQSVVEKRLMQQGKRRRDFSREEFIDLVQEWKDEYEATITEQLKSMGSSCDWPRQRFTMDDMCARAVAHAFFRLFRDGLIERGKRLVNWDPVTETALADDEVEMRDVAGHFWYLKYPVVDADGKDTGDFVTVATTRPETMLGDTAVAVNPDDPERAKYTGQFVRLPIVGRIIPIIADDYVVAPDPESSDAKAQYASGFLKVTPAHDPNDWEIGQRHDLPAINIMAPDASISDRHGWDDVSDEARRFIGLSREDARAAIVTWFRNHDLLAETRDYVHSVGHSYRSHEPVEPWLSDQWYVRVTDDRLVGEAQRALASDQIEGDPAPRASGAGAHADDGGVSFHPARYARTYQGWHDNLRDWCISRQLWWGHRIPVWATTFGSGDQSGADALHSEWKTIAESHPDVVSAGREDRDEGTIVQVCIDTWADGADDIVARAEKDGLTQDPDVLDTWFSSGLWPLSTMGWPNPDADTAGLIETFNPTNVLCTAREIITLWVSRMVMFGRYFNGGTIPFHDVYIHAMIQDGHGQKMSKSLGNGVDPRDIIHSHGADALRFTLTRMATGTQDVRLPVDIVSPFTDEAFEAAMITTAAGHRVAAPEQTCPTTGKIMVSAYGVASGHHTPSPEQPLARNTSSKFDFGRNFCSKLWNAARFACSRIESPAGPEAIDVASRPLIDRWIIGRMIETTHQINQAIDQYQFAQLAELLYDFIWRDVCDWYLESVKPTIGSDPQQQQILRTVLDVMIRLLHPVCPFVTETLWDAVRSLPGTSGLPGLALDSPESLAIASWPEPSDTLAAAADASTQNAAFTHVQELVSLIRTMRSQHQTPPKKSITLFAPAATRTLVANASGVVETMAMISAVEDLPAERPTGAVPIAFEGEELLLGDLVDQVDPEKERARLTRLIEDRSKAISGFRGKLNNAGYVNNAPAAVVEQTRGMLAEAEADLAAAERALADLG